MRKQNFLIVVGLVILFSFSITDVGLGAARQLKFNTFSVTGSP
jgi:hypothetical protein